MAFLKVWLLLNNTVSQDRTGTVEAWYETADSLIETLMVRGVKSVAVAEQYTLLVDPVDTTTRELKGVLRITSSSMLIFPKQ